MLSIDYFKNVSILITSVFRCGFIIPSCPLTASYT